MGFFLSLLCLVLVDGAFCSLGEERKPARQDGPFVRYEGSRAFSSFTREERVLQ